tara:strand:+ start:8859 stop:9017 length:159 start_codon:yes stop_codon:yes gene_type:complete
MALSKEQVEILREAIDTVQLCKEFYGFECKTKALIALVDELEQEMIDETITE